MSQDTDKFQEPANKPKANKSSDGFTAGLVVAFLIMIVVNTSTGPNKNDIQNNKQDINIGVVDTIVNTPDTQSIEQGASIFDTTFLFLKRMYEKNR